MPSEDDLQQKYGTRATVALVLALLCLIAWILPIVGIPLSIVALVFAAISLPTTRAIVAMVIAVLALAASGVNAYLGAVQYQRAAEQTEQRTTNSDQTETVDNTYQQAGIDEWGYPVDYNVNFLSSCSASGATAQACSCSLDVVHQEYAYYQVQQFEAQGTYPPEFTRIVQQTCG